MVMVDTSGSMIWHFGDCSTTGGDGGNPALFCDNKIGTVGGQTFDCNQPTCDVAHGAQPLFPTTLTNPSRLYAAKAALNDVINSASGSLDFGLERYTVASLVDSNPSQCPNGTSCCNPATGTATAGRCIGQVLNDYPVVPGNVSCGSLGKCNLTYLAGCGTSKGCSGSCTNTMGGQVLVQPSATSSLQVLPWVDFVEDFCNNGSGAPRNPELRAAGPTPLAGSVRTARLQWYKPIYDYTTDTVNHPNCLVGARNDPNPLCDPQIACRPYVNVVMTDGVESCESSGKQFTDPQNAVQELTDYNTTMVGPDGQLNKVRTYVIAMSFAQNEPCNNSNTDKTKCPGATGGGAGCKLFNGQNVCACNSDSDCGTTCEGPNPYKCDVVNHVCQHPALNSLNLMAQAGGTGTARFANNQLDIEAAFADIVASTVRVEKCNYADDDCNGVCDDAFPDVERKQNCPPRVGVPGYADGSRAPGTCDNGAVKGTTCYATGVFVCSGDGLSEVCNAPKCDAQHPELCPNAETCNNGRDDDCDGVIDDCNPGVQGSCPPCTCPACKAGPPGVPQPETCNGCDDDCDGTVDNNLIDTGGPCGSSVGMCEPGQFFCCQEGSPTVNSCSQSQAPKASNPDRLVCIGTLTATVEICNGVDDNCNGQIDEITNNCYPFDGGINDAGTGVGTCQVGTRTCTALPCGHVPDAGVPDAGGCCPVGLAPGKPCPGAPSFGACTGAVGPAAETCDNRDEDCDGVVDNHLGPPFGQPCCPTGSLADCTNTSAVDGGTVGTHCSFGALICDRGTAVCSGGIFKQHETCNGIDDDCNGIIDDVDGIGSPCVNGVVTGGVCHAAYVCDLSSGGPGPEINGLTCKQTVGPGPETCNGLDDDCDGTPDNHLTDVGGPCGLNCPGGNVANCTGVCVAGTMVCTNGSLQCSGSTGPQTEVCDGADNDCDGTKDNHLTDPWIGQVCCPTGNNADCTNTTTMGMTGTQCKTGTFQCVGGARTCDGGVAKSMEVCDGIDNDCNGLVDDVPGIGAPCTEGVVVKGPCTAKYVCTSSNTMCNGNGDCSGGEVCVGGHCRGAGPNGLTCKQVVGPMPEVCDGIDNNCDGKIDNVTCATGTCMSNGMCSDGSGGCDPRVGIAGGAPCVPLVPVAGTTLANPLPPPCSPGVSACRGGKLVCDGEVQPSPNKCNAPATDCTGKPNTAGSCAMGLSCFQGNCVTMCTNSEFPCPGGFSCDHSTNLCVPDKCAMANCPDGFFCSIGADGKATCNDPCVNVQCGPGFVCKLGACQDASCHVQGCPTGQLCVGTPPTCQPDPCFGVECPAGQFCNLEGKCATPCTACMTGEVCINGECAPDPCKGMECASDQVCAVVQGVGMCVENQCLNGCNAGLVCCTGMCVDDPCQRLQCPNGGKCSVDNGCNPTCTAPPRDSIAAAGGGGVACNVGGAAGSERGGTAFALLAVALATALSRRRRWLLALLAVGALASSGCSLNPYCLNCNQSGDGGPTGDGLIGDMTPQPDLTQLPDLTELQNDGGCVVTNGGVEVCDQIDNDCNGIVDDVDPTKLDPNNCGRCGNACDFTSTHRAGACVSMNGAPTCVPAACLPGFYDVDKDPSNGCEYACTPTDDPTEVCDGKDNDCDGTIDNGFGYPSYATDKNNCGGCGIACALPGAVPKCVADPNNGGKGVCVVDHCINNGTDTFRRNASVMMNTTGCLYHCPFPSSTTTTGSADCDNMTCVFPAETCNGFDDDCNQTVDDNLTDLGACTGVDNPCPNHDPARCVGQCKQGMFVCNGGVRSCSGGVGPSPEVCDNIDNDCNGTPDDNPTDTWLGQNCCPTGNVTDCQNTQSGTRCAVGHYQCAAGGVKSCNGGVAKSQETCNLVDDDCNGIPDDVPGIGQACTGNGTKTQGICTAAFVCNGASPGSGPLGLTCTQKIGPKPNEVCNGLDDDCDGTPDNNPVDVGGPCGLNCPAGDVANCVGACKKGTFVCQNGVRVCPDSTGPTAETCNGVDDDCNGLVDDPFTAAFPAGYPAGTMLGDNTKPLYNSDPANCGGCTGSTNYVCQLPHAINGCHSASANAQGNCRVVSCDSGFFYAAHTDSDPAIPTCNVTSGPRDSTAGDVTTGVGCNYSCSGTSGFETCDGVDNDCDGCIDNGLTPPTSFCSNKGVCNGKVIPVVCQHLQGWACNYTGIVPADDLTAGGQLAATEKECDGLDNNCNGLVDKDGFPTKGNTCTVGLGVCKGTDVVVCTNDHTGVQCNAVEDTSKRTDELCNGLDDDCDGLIDEPTNGPSLCTNGGSHFCRGWHDATVKVNNTFVYKYEASRPDATNANAGANSSRACSKPTVLPWADVTQAQAQAACAAVLDSAGKPMRLCTATEWQAACEGQGGSASAKWSFASTPSSYQALVCNDLCQDVPCNAKASPAVATTGSLASCHPSWPAGDLFDLSGNVSEWTSSVVRASGTSYFKIRGGAFDTPKSGTTCEFDFEIARAGFLSGEVGFRCCADDLTCGDTTSDFFNCGTCGHACSAGQVCDSGNCQATCTTAGLTACSGSCVNLQTNANDCGTCNNACDFGQSCVAGSCVCQKSVCDGRCVDTQTDVANCSTCDHACTGSQLCSSGVCCDAGLTVCGGNCVDTSSDVTHCGGCPGTACGGGQTCQSGICCDAGKTNCNGQCVDLLIDKNNCNACGNVCPSGICSNGSCCAPGSLTCAARSDGGVEVPVCVNPLTDPNNCGRCFNICDTGAGETCSNGGCCAAGKTNCSGACVDEQTDNGNCGSCGNACPTGSSCSKGVCTCSPGLSDCGGVCIPTAFDKNHCGSCTNVCSGGTPVCADSICVAACPAPMVQCGTSGLCHDPNIDNSACGGCPGTVCGNNQPCVNGTCTGDGGNEIAPTNPPAKCNPEPGPLIELGQDATGDGGVPADQCSGDIAATSFTFALCTCAQYASGGSQTFDAFNSSQGPYPNGSTLGGSVAANGGFNNGSNMSVSGDVWSGSAPSALKNGPILQQLHSVGNLSTAGNVSGNAFITSGTNLGGAGVSGFICADSCPVTGTTPTGGCKVFGVAPECPVSLKPPTDPCKRCAAAQQVPIQKFVTHYSNAANNDDAAFINGTTRTTVAQVANMLVSPTASRVDFPCGFYYFNSISGGSLTIVAHGNTAIFVGGNITLTGTLTVQVDPSARLDIFVAGDVTMGTANLGSQLFPSQLRFYVAQSCATVGNCASNGCSSDWSVGLSGGFSGADIYAPNGGVCAQSHMDFFGAIFANKFQSGGSINFHYDKAATQESASCPPPPSGCTSCLDCANQACNKPPASPTGTCGACSNDGDCCAPLRCVSGHCEFAGF
jgi:formylglycine-generating enzyme required for sulfatase activity